MFGKWGKNVSYAYFKTNLSIESYVNGLYIVKFHRCFASFRCSLYDLLIETGRYYGIHRDEHICP